MQDKQSDRISYGISEAAKVCGLGKTLIYEKIGSGELRSVKVGTRRLIMHSDLVSFIAGHHVPIDSDFRPSRS